MSITLGLDIYHWGRWHEAAEVEFHAPDKGVAGATTLRYLDSYLYEIEAHDPGERAPHIYALSICHPLTHDSIHLPTWPSFLLDLLPQGIGRAWMARNIGDTRDGPQMDLRLLLQAGGSPVGRVRIRQAAVAEQGRLRSFHQPERRLLDVGLREQDFLTEYEAILTHCPGAMGVSGAWPKMLMTRRRFGGWLPDPMVPDSLAVEWALLKWPRNWSQESRLILRAEAGYLELARAFGLRCGAPLRLLRDMLVVPRFDRYRPHDNDLPDGVQRVALESLVSATGVASFGHETNHETYLAAIKRLCSNPAEDVIEYVLRDLLNLALGNPDNHGRNTSLQTLQDGTVRLSPLYDFCPMRLVSDGVRRVTTWGCMKAADGRSRDLNPDWLTVCEVAADGVMDPSGLMAILKSKASLLREMPERARALNVPDEVILRAMGRCEELAESLE